MADTHSGKNFTNVSFLLFITIFHDSIMVIFTDQKIELHIDEIRYPGSHNCLIADVGFKSKLNRICSALPLSYIVAPAVYDPRVSRNTTSMHSHFSLNMFSIK